MTQLQTPRLALQDHSIACIYIGCGIAMASDKKGF
jgi:hypothetical protein